MNLDVWIFDPLLVAETSCTRTAFSTLVDELTHQGHLLVRHNKGLRCKVCNVYRAYKQFKFWSSHPCVPRPSAAAVISLFQNKKRQLMNTAAGNSRHVLDHCGAHNQTSNKHDEKELLHCTSLGYRDIQCTHSHPEHHPLPVSLEPELESVHTQQCCDYSLSQAAEQSGESHQVLTELHGYDMEGKRLRIASFDDTGGPRAPLRSNFDDQKPFPKKNAHSRTLYNTWSLFLGAQSSCVVLWVVLGLVRCLRWNMGTELGRSQLHVRSVGGFSRARTVGTSLLSRLDGQVWFLGVTHRAIKWCPKVWRKSWRIARNLIRFGTIRRVNSLGIEWERQCQPLWPPVRPASRCCTLLVSLSQVSTPLPRVISKIA